MPKHARTDNDNNSFEKNESNADLDAEYSDDLESDSEYKDDRDTDAGYSGETEELPEDENYPDAFESLMPEVDEAPLVLAPRGDHGRPAETKAWDSTGVEGKKPKKTLTPQQRKSRKTKRVLLVVIVLLVLLIGALVYCSYLLYEEAQQQAIQQTLQQAPKDVETLKDDETKDATTATTKKTEVPNLTGLIGKTQDEAIKLVGHGATAVSSTPVNEEGSTVKTEVKVSLTDEPGDTRSGTPTVYLGLDETGLVVRAGYSAATTTLGYGSSSFVDAITKDFIVEKTLNEAGLNLAEGSMVLPKDKAEYTTYKTDKKTVVKETYSFSGLEPVNGAEYEWSAVLRYDYTAENASGNLADTIRQIYIYIGLPSASMPTDQAAGDQAATEQPAPTGDQPAPGAQ